MERLKKIILISILVSVVAFMLATLIALIKRKPEEPVRNEPGPNDAV
jgi:hypothetical protein